MTTDVEPKTRPWDAVRRLADEVRLKVHLATMEIKARWEALEPEIRELEDKMGKVGTKVEGVIAGQLATLAAACSGSPTTCGGDQGERPIAFDMHLVRPSVIA